ncbi:hypothetical protein MN608_09957 [Microdochium nivale]|nr:hypothetical protein MN608_09957 [Microdochium nivale]
MAGLSCGAQAAATYYNNPVWMSATICSAPPNAYTTALYTSQPPDAVSTICDDACDAQQGSAAGGGCRAYIATASYDAARSAHQVRCFLYTTQVPSPVTAAAASCTAGSKPPPQSVVARYRDGAAGCLARSAAQAARFCSSLLQRPAGPGVTVGPQARAPPAAATTTVTSVVTKSVCMGAGARKRIVYDDDDDYNDNGDDDDVYGLPEPTEQPAAPTNPVHFPKPTPTPHYLQQQQPRAAEPAPACLKTLVYPLWNVPAACECLLANTEPPSPAKTAAAAVAPAAAGTTHTVTHTSTTRVSRSAVATFQPQLVVPGKTTAEGGGGQFKLTSRMIGGDAAQQRRRMLVYTKEATGVGGGDGISGTSGNVDMHVGKLDQRMYMVSRERHVLKPYGSLSLVPLAGAGGGAGGSVTVIGQLSSPSSSSSSGGGGGASGNGLASGRAAGDDDEVGVVSGVRIAAEAEFVTCFAVSQPGGDVTCRIAGSNMPVVFSEVLVPGETKRYAIAVGTAAVPGAKVVRMIATGWGSVVVGCGASGKD